MIRRIKGENWVVLILRWELIQLVKSTVNGLKQQFSPNEIAKNVF